MQKMQFLGFKAFVFSWNKFIFAKAKEPVLAIESLFLAVKTATVHAW